MKYVEGIGITVYNVLKTYTELIEDKQHETWEEIPKWRKEGILADVNKFMDNPNLTMKDIHNKNYNSKKEKGWKFGEKISVTKKEDPDMVEYNDLPLERRIYMSLYEIVIKTMLEI